MDKSILIKYIRGTASENECVEVLEWAKNKTENREYLISLLNMEAILPTKDRKLSESEYEFFKSKLRSRQISRTLRKYLKYAAIILLFLSVTTNIFWLIKKDKEYNNSTIAESLFKNYPDSLMQEIYVVKGAKSKITLPDGSLVWLNSDSKIKFPLSFTSKTRHISFSGEAFFDVVKDTLRPMVISLDNNYYIKVLGTKFNIRSYKNDDEIQATLYSGKINIISGKKNKEIRSLKPHETFIIQNAGNESVSRISDLNMEKISAWKKGIIFFDETPMIDVIKTLERWHGIIISVKDKDVLNYTITAKFNNESAVQILEMLKICAPIDYSIQDNTVNLYKR